MAKVKKKLTPAQKRAKKAAKAERQADPIWLHQNEMWEQMPVEDALSDPEPSTELDATEDEDRIPF
ncbi:hypothetical protein [Salinivibrio kushneri]|uniref:hypothetical protein n=1 Tax=Salinivibrio kushneri TaxID=1908198 RepID=UPI0009895FDC|nr:hypothetical protein [Salinivibrio kushneri]OOE49140.1 hypothetical protein BZG10_09990 [Salinivibrio kushneri]